jgi:acyl-coenzyme A thioesterase PaaI-like protein
MLLGMTEMPAPDSAYDRLGAALRALSDVVVRSSASDAEVDAAAEQIEALCDQLGGPANQGRFLGGPTHAMSLVGGTAHPMAPQLSLRPSDNGAVGTVTLGPAYEGAPGLAHGGVLSLLIDHAMGYAVNTAGYGAMTVSLEVRYRVATQLGVPLSVRAAVDRVEGRKVFVTASITAGDTTTVEATGVFLKLTAANVAQLFARERIPNAWPRKQH